VTSSAYVPAKRTLEYGMHGSDVRALQQRLEQLTYYPGAADGQFGSSTLEAVWAFQEVQGLSADGIVGPHTAHVLVSPRAPQSRYPRGGALRVEVNLRLRVLLLYRNNKLALVSHVSSGGGYYFCSDGSCSYAITPAGHFATTRFMPGWVTVPLGQMYNPVFFIGTAYAIHGDTDVPLQPVSHGCVRVPMDIAAFFHTLVKTPGTPVYIYN
jgi:peptidoglycan hydrolase-like protein with peptidoglycan-binding domain